MTNTQDGPMIRTAETVFRVTDSMVDGGIQYCRETREVYNLTHFHLKEMLRV